MIDVSELMADLNEVGPPVPRSYENDERPAFNKVAAKIRASLNLASEAEINAAAIRNVMEEQARELARVRFELAETIERARLDNLKHLEDKGWGVPPEMPDIPGETAEEWSARQAAGKQRKRDDPPTSFLKED